MITYDNGSTEYCEYYNTLLKEQYILAVIKNGRRAIIYCTNKVRYFPGITIFGNCDKDKMIQYKHGILSSGSLLFDNLEERKREE